MCSGYVTLALMWPLHLLFSKAKWHTAVLQYYGRDCDHHVNIRSNSFMDQESKQAEVWAGHWHLIHKPEKISEICIIKALTINCLLTHIGLHRWRFFILCHVAVFAWEATGLSPRLLVLQAIGGNPPAILLVVRHRYTVQFFRSLRQKHKIVSMSHWPPKKHPINLDLR